MLETVVKKAEESKSELDKVNPEQKVVEKTKKLLLDYF